MASTGFSLVDNFAPANKDQQEQQQYHHRPLPPPLPKTKHTLSLHRQAHHSLSVHKISPNTTPLTLPYTINRARRSKISQGFREIIKGPKIPIFSLEFSPLKSRSTAIGGPPSLTTYILGLPGPRAFFHFGPSTFRRISGDIAGASTGFLSSWVFLCYGPLCAEVLVETIAAIKAFHEQPTEEKSKYYVREEGRGVMYASNNDLYRAKAACWHDSLQVWMSPEPAPAEDIPAVCRREVVEWDLQATKVADCVMRLLSEGLGLEAGKFKELTFSDARVLVGHCYPYCPQPDLISLFVMPTCFNFLHHVIEWRLYEFLA